MADKRVKIIKHNNISVKFEVDSRYSPLESIGTGAYGVVCAAKDNRTGQRVAIKKIPKVFEMLIVAKRTYRELKILRHLRHENIISILDVMQPPEDLAKFDDVYVVLDLMESDLHHIIHSVQPLSDEHIKFFLYQIMRGLKYIHSANVLHRDLKPSNLLINRNCELKIGDFGMARGLSSSSEDHATFMTEYVATRWYRAPELMLSLSEYTFSIDMWSVGCIFAEMLGRRQLFPGKNYLNQLQLILSVVGTPSEEYITNVGSDRVKTYLQTLPLRKPVELSMLFPNASPVALDLLDHLLQLEPKKRISPEDALAHKYLSQYHDLKDEPICTPPFDFTFEKKLLTKDELRKAIIDEIMDYHKCKIPIPSQDKVKDALKKLMEDREKAQKEGEGRTGKEGKEPKEGTAKRKKIEDKKRRHHPEPIPVDKRKRPKIEGLPNPDEPECRLSEQDKNVLDRWKRIQLTTRPFIHPHPVRNLGAHSQGNGADGMSMAYIQQQSDQIEQQQRQIAEQKRVIQDQNNQIRVLQEQQKALIYECQAAGIKVPQSVSQDAITAMGHPSQSTLPPKKSGVPYSSAQPAPLHPQPPGPPLQQPVTCSPAQVLSMSMNPPPPFPNISPPNARHPPPPQPMHLPHRTPPPQSTISCLQNPQMSTTHFLLPPAQQQTVVSASAAHLSLNQTSHVLASKTSYPPNEAIGTSTSPTPANLMFSPLTPGEFITNEPQNIPSYSPNPYEPFPDELDNILNIAGLPTGSGAGYGVGVLEEELPLNRPQLDLSDLGPVISAPPSASLLRDWLDVRQLDPSDMDALQKELESGAPDMFFRGLEEF